MLLGVTFVCALCTEPRFSLEGALRTAITGSQGTSVFSFSGFSSKVSVFIYTPTHNHMSSQFSLSSSILGIDGKIFTDGYEKLSH